MELPTPFGPYVLLERLGHGGMAEVFRARIDGAAGFTKLVALKRLLPQWRDDAQRARMFLEEARLQALLHHKNLVQAHALELIDGLYAVQLELVDGGDLATVRGEAPLEERAVLFLAQELLLGLFAVHQARDPRGLPLGLVHRDVSPGNVLLSRSGEVKLSDFGIAKATARRDETRAGVRKGTWAYMSPEQARGAPLTAASDLFSLGVLLVELLTGALPWPAEGPLELLERIREAAPPPLPQVSEALRPALLRLLAAEPRQRFESAAQAHLALRALASHHPPFGAPELAALVHQRLDAAAPAPHARRTRLDTEAVEPQPPEEPHVL